MSQFFGTWWKIKFYSILFYSQLVERLRWCCSTLLSTENDQDNFWPDCHWIQFRLVPCWVLQKCYMSKLVLALGFNVPMRFPLEPNSDKLSGKTLRITKWSVHYLFLTALLYGEYNDHCSLWALLEGLHLYSFFLSLVWFMLKGTTDVWGRSPSSKLWILTVGWQN